MKRNEAPKGRILIQFAPGITLKRVGNVNSTDERHLCSAKAVDYRRLRSVRCCFDPDPSVVHALVLFQCSECRLGRSSPGPASGTAWVERKAGGRGCGKSLRSHRNSFTPSAAFDAHRFSRCGYIAIRLLADRTALSPHTGYQLDCRVSGHSDRFVCVRDSYSQHGTSPIWAHHQRCRLHPDSVLPYLEEEHHCMTQM